MGKANSPCQPCCAGPCTWVITVNDCLAGRSGVTVTVTHGGGTAAGTTNGSGVATITGLATGSATATAAAPNAKFVDTAVTVTLVAGSQSSTINLSAATGYACAGKFGCTDPIPTTLTGTYYHYAASDCAGVTLIAESLTLTWSGGVWLSGWYSLCIIATGDNNNVGRIVLRGSLVPNVMEDLDAFGDGSYVRNNSFGNSQRTAASCSPFVLDMRLYIPTTSIHRAGSLYITE